MDEKKSGKEVEELIDKTIEDEIGAVGNASRMLVELMKKNPAYAFGYLEIKKNKIERELTRIALMNLALSKATSELSQSK